LPVVQLFGVQSLTVSEPIVMPMNWVPPWAVSPLLAVNNLESVLTALPHWDQPLVPTPPGVNTTPVADPAGCPELVSKPSLNCADAIELQTSAAPAKAAHFLT
jgi:hypothetical protein